MNLHLLRRPLCLTVLLLGVNAPGALATVAGPTEQVRDHYQMFTIGDSAAAGEGAPDIDGRYSDSGDVLDSEGDGEKDYEDWDTRFGGPPSQPGLNQDSTRCHRSGHHSTSAVARDHLQAQFPDVIFDLTSVACSGASILEGAKLGERTFEGGVLRPYRGVDNLSKRGIDRSKLKPAMYEPQLDQLNSILARRAGLRRRIDALLMNLGVNDAGFGSIVEKCLDLRDLRDDECHFQDDNAIPKFVARTLGTLNSRFNRLAAALRGTPTHKDPRLEHRPAAVFLTALPNPVQPSNETFCDHQPADGVERALGAAEARWLRDNVLVKLNARFATEAAQHAWGFVNSHVNGFIGHAFCSSDNFIHTNLSSLRIQGELDQTNIPVLDPFVNVGGSIMHPNRAGYALIGAAVAERMQATILRRYTPLRPPVLTTSSRSTGFSVSVSDATLPRLRSGYWHRITLRQLDPDQLTVAGMPAPPRVINVSGPDGLRDIGYGTTVARYARTGRYLVSARACGPLSRDGSRGCGPATAQMPVSTFVPASPVSVRARGGDAPVAVMPTPGFVVRWAELNALASHDTRHSILRVRRQFGGSSKGTVRTVRVPGPGTTAVVTGLDRGIPYLVSVKACNDGGRCSAFTEEVTVRAARGSRLRAR